MARGLVPPQSSAPANGSAWRGSTVGRAGAAGRAGRWGARRAVLPCTPPAVWHPLGTNGRRWSPGAALPPPLERGPGFGAEPRGPSHRPQPWPTAGAVVGRCWARRWPGVSRRSLGRRCPGDRAARDREHRVDVVGIERGGASSAGRHQLARHHYRQPRWPAGHQQPPAPPPLPTPSRRRALRRSNRSRRRLTCRCRRVPTSSAPTVHAASRLPR